MELLEDKSNFFRAIADHCVFVEPRQVDAVNHHAAGSQRIQPAKNIDQRGFAGARRPHQRHPFARSDVERHAAQRAQRAVLLHQPINHHLRPSLARLIVRFEVPRNRPPRTSACTLLEKVVLRVAILSRLVGWLR